MTARKSLPSIRFIFFLLFALTICHPAATLASEFDKTFQQAAQAYSEGRLYDALDAFRLASRSDPANGPVRANIASVLYQLGKKDEALAEYREAVRIKSDFGGAYASMADLLERMERTEEAFKAYNEAIRLMPENSFLLVRRANVLRRLGRYDEALADVDAAIRIRDKSGYAHAARGIILLKKQHWIDATEAFRKALALEPAYPIEAAKSGDDELIQTAVQFGATLKTQTKDGLTVLMAAIANDRISTAAKLIGLGADVNVKAADGINPLILAAGRGQEDTVERLLRHGADIHAKRHNGGTALMAAAARGHGNVIRTLIEKGSDVNAKDAQGGTALMIASERGHTNAAEILLKAKADVNAIDAKGNTALIQAAFFGRHETSAVLIARGASVNIRNHEGWTPLLTAVYGKHRSMVQLLIHRGADINIYNKSGLSPAALAGSRGDEDIFNLLKTAGAKESFDFTKKDALVFGKIIFIEDGKEITNYSIFNRPTPELFHADTEKIVTRIQLTGFLTEAVNEDGSFCWQIKRGSYLMHRINRFGAARADHFVYPQTAFLAPYGADAYYLGTLRIHITTKRNFLGEKSVEKVLSVDVVDDPNGSQQQIKLIKPDFSGTTGKSLMIHSTALPKFVKTTSTERFRIIQILNALTTPLLMVK